MLKAAATAPQLFGKIQQAAAEKRTEKAAAAIAAGEQAQAAMAEQLAAKESELAALLESTEEINSHRVKMMFLRLDRDSNGTISKEVYHCMCCWVGW